MAVLTTPEREQVLDDASEKYMRGDMSAEEFEAVEERYMTDYSVSLQALAKYLMRPRMPMGDRMWAGLLQWLTSRHRHSTSQPHTPAA